MAINLSELWKKGTTAPAADDIVEAGLAIDINNKKAYSKGSDGTVFEIGGSGGGTWGSIEGTLSDQTDLQDELDAKFSESEHVDISAGNIDAAKPIVLNANGSVDNTMLEFSSLTLEGPHTPTNELDEYPTGGEAGSYWTITGLDEELGYTYVGGNLAGQTIENGQFLLQGKTEFAIVKSRIEPSTVYLLDGSNAITDRFAGGGQIFGNAGDGVDASDLATFGQLTDVSDAVDANTAAILLKPDADDVFAKTEHINASTGTGDAAKPIILDANGKIDGSMMTFNSLYLVGPFTPVAGTEYPDVTSETPGAYWSIVGVDATNGYTFTEGDLVGQVVFNGDYLLNGSNSFVIVTASVEPDMYYRLDGTVAITADFAAGGKKIANIADGALAQDAVSLTQMNVVNAKVTTNTADIALKANITDVFDKTDHVNTSTGTGDAAKPIVLNGSGKVASNMIDFDTLTYEGNFTPNAGGVGPEYPDDGDIGSYWSVASVDPIDGYTFNSGDLAGETVYDGDFMLNGRTSWAIVKSKIDPEVVYLLDGTNAITADFAGGGFKLTNLADGVADTDAATVGQLSEGGASTFVELTDTPDDYTGNEGLLVKVNATGDGLIFGDPSGSTVSWGDIQGTLASQTDLQGELDDRFLEIEHVNASAGLDDAAKPIVLNASGLIDASMMQFESLVYEGSFNPSASDEYPNGGDVGSYWSIAIPSEEGYTFTEGDLIGDTIYDGDFMLFGRSGWAIVKGKIEPSIVYLLDGSNALTADFSGGGFQLKSIADGTLDTDGATFGQVNSKEDSLGNPSSDGHLLSSLVDGTRSWIVPPTGGSAEWGSISGTLSSQTDLQDELNLKFSESEHVSVSAGIDDAGKPIILNSGGRIDSSMLEFVTLTYAGPYTPTDDTDEYPTGGEIGWYWSITGVDTSTGYTYVGGSLAGEVVYNGDYLLQGEIEFGIVKSKIEPNTVYMLDGTNALTANFNGGGFQIKSIIDGTADTDAVTVSQLNALDITESYGYTEYTNANADDIRDTGVYDAETFIDSPVASKATLHVSSNVDENDSTHLITTQFIYDGLGKAFTRKGDKNGDTETWDEWHSVGATSTFIDLLDTPTDYTGQQGLLVKVNATEDGLIFGDPSGTTVSWGDIQGTLLNQTDLQNALDAKFEITAHIDVSAGADDAAKPIVLNGSGRVDTSMLEFVTLIYAGPHTPTDDTDEYPTGGEIGWYWSITGVDDDTGYTFIGGNLADDVIHNGDFLLQGETEFGIVKSKIEPSTVYLLDGSNPITANFNAGGFEVRNVADGTVDSASATVGQLNRLQADDVGAAWEVHGHMISDIQDLWTQLDSKALASHEHNDLYYLETEFVDVSTGTPDGAKPIVLDGNGLIDSSMMSFDTLEYQTSFTPDATTEYPTVDVDSIGFYWNVAGVDDVDGYTFTTGDLIGDVVENGDYMLYGRQGWGIVKSKIDPNIVYLLDGSQALTGDFAGGGFKLTNIAAGTVNSDAANMGQVIVKEDNLGNPTVDGNILSSTIAGARTWVTPPSGDMTKAVYDTDDSGIVDNSELLGGFTPALLPISTATQTALDLKYDESDHISVSVGTGDGGKPIVLTGDGLIDTSMMDFATLEYQSGFTPDAAIEYPTVDVDSIGFYWSVDGVDEEAGYTFASGDLISETVFNGDYMLYGRTGWGIVKSKLDPSIVYYLDGSKAITGDFAGGGFKITNIIAGTADTDGATVGQVNAAPGTYPWDDLSDTSNIHPDDALTTGVYHPHTIMSSPVGDTGVLHVSVRDNFTPVEIIQFIFDTEGKIASRFGSGAIDSITWEDWVIQGSDSGGTGDMLKSVYDTDDSGIVDDSEMVGGFTPALLPVSTATQTALDLKFDITDHINVSTGAADAAKPIILDADGVIDSSMLTFDTLIYEGNFTPNAGGVNPEYPNDGDVGSYWSVASVDETDGYTFNSGDLSGETVYNGDFMLQGRTGWGIVKSKIDPEVVYLLDGSKAITADFQAGGFKLSNIGDGVAGTDAVSMSQLGSHIHTIDEVTDLQTELDTKINSAQEEAVGTSITNIISLTQTEYDALTAKLGTTMYLIVG